jgi:mannosyltransferase
VEVAVSSVGKLASVLGSVKAFLSEVTDHARRRPALWAGGLLLAITFAAYGLRTLTLTSQSMWIDEVMALEFTDGTFKQTIDTIVQPEHNGPLFYLLLFLWRQIVGDSDFAVRYLSVLLSVLTIPLLFRWARAVAGRKVGVIVVSLLALSPFTLWYGQEGKMYALHMLAAVASSLMLFEAFRKGSWYRWLAYGLLTPVVLYSHFFGALLLLTQGATALLLGWRRWRRLLAYSGTMAAVVAAHLPLIRLGLRVLEDYRPQERWRFFVGLQAIARDILGRFFFRLAEYDLQWWQAAIAGGLVLIGGLAAVLKRRREPVAVALQAWLPILLFYAVSFSVPVYAAKYLSSTLPALFILTALAIQWLARLWKPAGLLLLALGAMMLGSVVRDLTEPAFQRGDWRFVTDYVEAHEGSNDVVLIYADYAINLFERYYEGGSVVSVPTDPGMLSDPWPYYRELAEQYDRLWLVLYHDRMAAPDNYLQAGVQEQYPMITGQYPNGARIALVAYQFRLSYASLPQEATALDACFANGLCLVGYMVDETALTATDPPPEPHPPSNWLHVVLYWQREPEIDETTVKPLVRLIDGAYQVWGGDMQDYRSLFRRFPPEQWSTGGVIESHFDLNLNPVTPPGTYRLEVSLAVEGDENRRAALLGPEEGMPGDRLVFETITIEQP